MGRLFLHYPSGTRIFCCAKCNTPLTNRENLRSTRFTGSTGRAFLFDSCVNVKFSATIERIMLTGRHTVRDVHCIVCSEKLGWSYEYACEEGQRYKEGKVILEKLLIKEIDGFDEDKPVYKDTKGNNRRRNREDNMTDDENEDDDDDDLVTDDDDDDDSDDSRDTNRNLPASETGVQDARETINRNRRNNTSSSATRQLARETVSRQRRSRDSIYTTIPQNILFPNARTLPATGLVYQLPAPSSSSSSTTNTMQQLLLAQSIAAGANTQNITISPAQSVQILNLINNANNNNENTEDNEDNNYPQN